MSGPPARRYSGDNDFMLAHGPLPPGIAPDDERLQPGYYEQAIAGNAQVVPLASTLDSDSLDLATLARPRVIGAADRQTAVGVGVGNYAGRSEMRSPGAYQMDYPASHVPPRIGDSYHAGAILNEETWQFTSNAQTVWDLEPIEANLVEGPIETPNSDGAIPVAMHL
jgi:hypothetical protein